MNNENIRRRETNEGKKEGLAMNSVVIGTMFSSKHLRLAGYRRLHCPYSTTNG
jgi:hypothetical protein